MSRHCWSEPKGCQRCLPLLSAHGWFFKASEAARIGPTASSMFLVRLRQTTPQEESPECQKVVVIHERCSQDSVL